MSYIEKKTVDAQGLICPEPIMMLHAAIRDVAVGDVVKVMATDPSTERDIKQFCEFLSHELLHFEQCDQLYTYWVKKQ